MTHASWCRRYGATALRQGWGLFNANGVLEIQRDDTAAIFPTDEAAVDYVGAAMLRGDKGALAALKLVNGS